MADWSLFAGVADLLRRSRVERRAAMTDAHNTIEGRYFGLLEELGGIDEVAETTAFFERACQLYGLKNIAYMALDVPKIAETAPYIAVTYSDQWVRHYKSSNFVAIDPVLNQGLRSILPLDWRSFRRESRPVTHLFGEAAEFGVGCNGITFPIRGRMGEKAIFTVTSDLRDSEWDRASRHFVRDFQLMSFHVHQMILRAEKVETPPCILSPREIECLRWAAAGKTVSDIAIILSLSDRTVRFYLDLARHTLGTVNITHTVAKALHLCII